MSENKTIFLGNETLRILYPNKLFFCLQDNNESDWERINIDIKIKEFYKYEKSLEIASNVDIGGRGCNNGDGNSRGVRREPRKN